MNTPRLSALESRSDRRRLARALLAGAGGSLLTLAAVRSARFAFAQSDDDDDDSSGRGRGRGRGGDNSGPGNAEDRGEAAVVQAEIPAGSLEIRIVSDDAGGFVPAELTVDLGQSVTFVNAHSDEHTATGSGFDTGIIPEGSIATVVLVTPGVFRYACQIHPEMTGRIDVRDESGVVPQATPEQAPAGAPTVRLVNLAYDPGELAVPVGATVTWRNEDAVPHTVTADDGSFDSGIFDPGASFSQTFDQAGSFAYHCQLHPTMQGTIRVGDEAGAVAAQPAASPPTPAALDAAGATEVGVWRLEFAPDDPAAFGAYLALVDMRPDGTLGASFVAVTATVPPAVLTSGHGEWEQQAGLRRMSLIALMEDESRRFAGFLTIQTELRLGADGQTLEGPFTYVIADGSGERTGAGAGTIIGESAPLAP